MSPARSSRPFIGVQAIRQAEVLREQMAKRSDWPYVHIYPPPNSIPLHQIGSALVPAMGATADILTYQVPSGLTAYVVGVLAEYSGQSVFSPGDILWSLTQNVSPAGAPVDFQGAPVQGLALLPIPLGKW